MGDVSAAEGTFSQQSARCLATLILKKVPPLIRWVVSRNMWHRFIVVGLSVALWVITPSAALACTGVLEIPNNVALIAEGWVRSAGRSWFSPRSRDNLKVVIDVTQSLKGEAPTPLIFFSMANDPPGAWFEAPSRCGELPSDLVGRYALIIFRLDESGALRTDSTVGAVFGTGPDDESISRFRRYIHANLAANTESSVIPGPTWDLTWVPAVARYLIVIAGGIAVSVLGGIAGKDLLPGEGAISWRR